MAEDTEEPTVAAEEEVERYYVIEKIQINNHGAGTININIIQQGQPSTPPPRPPGT